MLELVPVQEIPTRGLAKFLVGGMQSVLGLKPALQPWSLRPEDYDLIFLGTPERASRYGPAMRSFLAQTPLRGKKVALFSCHADEQPGALTRLRADLAGSTLLGEIAFTEPLKAQAVGCQGRARAWAQGVLQQAQSTR